MANSKTCTKPLTILTMAMSDWLTTPPPIYVDKQRTFDEHVLEVPSLTIFISMYLQSESPGVIWHTEIKCRTNLNGEYLSGYLSLVQVTFTIKSQEHWVIFLTNMVANLKAMSSKDYKLVLLSSRDIEF